MNTKLKLSLGTMIVAGTMVAAGCGDDDGTTTATSNTSNTSNTSSMGGGGGGTGDGGGGGDAAVHGCTYETATDMTGNAEVSAAATGEWIIGYNACIKVDSGTKVTWTGNFTTHPLNGGVSPTEDTASAISNDATGDGVVEVTFDSAGEHPFFCGVHVGTMTGVIYVD